MLNNQFKSAVSDLLFNIRRVMRLAFAIDGKLVVMYYATAAVGAVMPVLAALLFKIAIRPLPLPHLQIVNASNQVEP